MNDERTPEQNATFWLTITAATVITGFNRILARFGDDHKATNPNGSGGCIYAVMNDGIMTPVCIVGQFFADLGLLGLLLSDPTDPSDGAFCTKAQPNNLPGIASAVNDLRHRGIEVEDAAFTILAHAQSVQDSGYTWREAFEAGLRDAV